MELNALSTEADLIKQRWEQLVSQAKQNFLFPEGAKTLANMDSGNEFFLKKCYDCDFKFQVYPKDEEDNLQDHIHSMGILNSDKTPRDPKM